MKKTTPLQKRATVNRHQLEMQKIANKMAVLFEQKFTPSLLSRWLVLAREHSSTADTGMLWHLGYCTLPELIECKTKKNRIDFLIGDIFQSFSDPAYATDFLFQLGADFLLKTKNVLYTIKNIKDFMGPYTTLLAILELFNDYSFEKGYMQKDEELLKQLHS